MFDAPVTLAAQDDVAYFSRRRRRDERGRQLYCDLAEVAPHGAWIAREETGTPIGIAFLHASEDESYVSEIYVEPGYRRQGIAWKLFAAASLDAGDLTRSGLLESDPVAGLAFFLRRGLSLQTPVLGVSGAIPSDDDLLAIAAGEYRFATERIDPVADRTAVASLDREVRGTARPLDHAYFAERAHGVVFRLEGEFVGYAYVWPDGSIGPLAAASGAYAVQFFAYALIALRRTLDASWCKALVPGTNLRILRAATRAGLSIEAVRLFASDAGVSDLSRYVGFHQLLF